MFAGDAKVRAPLQAETEAAPPRGAADVSGNTTGCRHGLGPQARRISCAATCRRHAAPWAKTEAAPAARAAPLTSAGTPPVAAMASGRKLGGYLAQRHAAGMQLLGQRHDVRPSGAHHTCPWQPSCDRARP